MDIILTTNSPGEVSAWVRPMIKTLKEELPDSRITVFIPPCTFASGREVPVVQSFPEVSQVVGPGAYINYLVFRRKPRDFHPGKKGFVLFLGGDLGHAVFLGKRLNYPVYAYSERAAGHVKSIRLFFVPNTRVADRLQRKGIPLEKICLVGDLMLDAIKPDTSPDTMKQLLHLNPNDFVLNIFPGSRPHEVRETLPFFLETLMQMLEKRELVPVITLAPFITPDTLQSFLRKVTNFAWEIAKSDHQDILELKLNGQKIWVYSGISYNIMQISHLVLSLPGTNNVELAGMGIPTLVVLPLNWPELIPLPGIIGMISEIPLLGGWLKGKVVIPRILPKFKYVSPVNRTLDRLILPELIGVLEPQRVAVRALEVIEHQLPVIKEKLKGFKNINQVSSRILKLIKTDFEN